MKRKTESGKAGKRESQKALLPRPSEGRGLGRGVQSHPVARSAIRNPQSAIRNPKPPKPMLHDATSPDPRRQTPDPTPARRPHPEPAPRRDDPENNPQPAPIPAQPTSSKPESEPPTRAMPIIKADPSDDPQP
jgi:hypothetical protein